MRVRHKHSPATTARQSTKAVPEAIGKTLVTASLLLLGLESVPDKGLGLGERLSACVCACEGESDAFRRGKRVTSWTKQQCGIYTDLKLGC